MKGAVVLKVLQALNGGNMLNNALALYACCAATNAVAKNEHFFRLLSSVCVLYLIYIIGQTVLEQCFLFR